MPSHNSDPTLWALIGFGGGLFTFFRGFKVYREYRTIEDTPRIPVRSIAMGLVRIHGAATGDTVVSSPVTRTPCYFYKVDIEKWKTDSKGRGSWSHDVTDTGGVRFYLDDGTGRVLVDARDAEYDLPQTGKREVGGSRTTTTAGASSSASEAELLNYVREAHARRFTGFAEHLLTAVGPRTDPGHERARQAAISALESFKSGASPAQLRDSWRSFLGAQGPLADPEKERKRLAALNSLQHLRESSLPSFDFHAAGGRYRFTEYCILPGQSYDITGTCAENLEATAGQERNIILKGQNDPTFLISSQTAREVETRLHRRAALRIFGGAALSLACLAFLLYKFGLF
jgi:hypothetical protein